MKEFIKKLLKENLENNLIWYHGSQNKFNEFKLKSGTLHDYNYNNPIFLTSNVNFAKAYAGQNGYIYEIKIINSNIFDFRLLEDYWELNESSYGNKLYNDIESGKYDLKPYDTEDADKLYSEIQSGEYAYLERIWFFNWLKNNNFDGSYIIETRELNIMIFNPKNLKILKINEIK